MREYTFAEAQEAFAKMPYFLYPQVSALKNADAGERAVLVRRIAAAVGDEAVLRGVLGIDPAEFADFYPDMRPPELTTEATIDTFISTFSSEKKAAATQVDELVAAPAVDYAAMLAEEEPLPEGEEPEHDATFDMLDSFLASNPPKVPKPVRKEQPSAAKEQPAAAQPPVAREPAAAQPPAAKEPISAQPSAAAKEPTAAQPAATEAPAAEAHKNGDLSEGLLKIMIKNGNYSKALEIINELSLNNPKKSIYFADQTRFLKKLILNQERKEAAKPAAED